MEYKIACVIVTFNRKKLLKRCLDAVAAQTFKPKVVFITDNASTDGTIDSVKEWGYYNCMHNGIEFKYILNSKNEGGAGGFYLGMYSAVKDDEYDALWVMDDDGIPDKECLKELSYYLGTHHYIAPIVIAEEDSCLAAFNGLTKDELLAKSKDGKTIIGWANPFNGILYSKTYIETVGFPKKDMFIWGDENNYHIRAQNSGIFPVTIIKAIHIHPMDRQIKIKFLCQKVSVIYSEAAWKQYCFIRNRTYNYSLMYDHIDCMKHRLKLLITYLMFYTIKKTSISRILLVINAYRDGKVGNFSKLDQYF